VSHPAPTTIVTASASPAQPRRRRLVAVASALVAVCIAACARQMPPRATPLDAERSHVSVDDLEHGRSLLVAKCGSRCHKAPLPSDKVVSEWPKALDEMAPRANLTAPDRRAIEQYLLAMAPR
jgi:hypothetical protein